MKDRITDENDENDANVVKAPKPVLNTEKNPPIKATKPTKQTSLTLKQALQNVDFKNLFYSLNVFFSFIRLMLIK